LFLSTDENEGVEPLAPLDAPLGEEELGEAEEELDAPPEALPDDLLLSVALGLALDPDLSDEVLCAAATPASAKRAAAVAV
jgi:hypothetical protein